MIPPQVYLESHLTDLLSDWLEGAHLLAKVLHAEVRGHGTQKLKVKLEFASAQMTPPYSVPTQCKGREAPPICMALCHDQVTS